MSSRCRICVGEMPKDRHGYEQVCPKCKEEGHKELWEKDCKPKWRDLELREGG